METYLELKPEEAAEYAILRAQEKNQEVEDMKLTWGERLQKEAWEKAQEQVQEQVREQVQKQVREEIREAEARRRDEIRLTQLQEARRFLFRLLAKRFGPLPEVVRDRVEALSSVERIQEIGEQLLAARSLDELGFA